MIENTAGYYLHDLGLLIREAALEAKAEADKSGDDFSKGQLWAYLRVVSLMQSQAETFEIALEHIRLDEIDPYTDLLSGDAPQPPNTGG